MLGLLLLLTAVAAVGSVSCSKSRYNPAADHNVAVSGARHKSGLKEPASNCISCHGGDLKGGNSGVSCFECHGNEWDKKK